jgi:hypothetical protein
MHGVPAFRRAGWGEGVSGGEMRLADQRGVVAGARQFGSEAAARRLLRQVDAVVADAMGARQQPRQDGSPRRLADQVRADRAAEQHAFLREQVHVRRVHLAAHDAEAIATLLVGGDEQDVRTRVEHAEGP